jgi:hypothetical protein
MQTFTKIGFLQSLIHLWKPNKDGGTLNLDDAEMLTKERDARIATAGVAALMRDEFIHARTLHDWEALALGETILQSPGTWATEKEYDTCVVNE